MARALHVEGGNGRPLTTFEIRRGESIARVMQRLGVTVRFTTVPDKPRKLSPGAAEFIAAYQREEAGSVLAVFWRYHSLEAEDFDTVEEAERFLDGGAEFGSLAGEAIVAADGTITVRD